MPPPCCRSGRRGGPCEKHGTGYRGNRFRSASANDINFGCTEHFVPETLRIFLVTIACLVGLLFLVARTWRGTALPLLAGVTSTIWALGSSLRFQAEMGLL